ncbi:MAG TPA: prepilin-type N-terminal cleavage/methylation domain-containing protein [Phycisphaerae bacterium]|nr:prepilin-type N-terminal cleavage/methylation domain-containing protein [Phycisphaerae bacterium]HRY70978.1 prepilin-type N-terminal cleavage/methylation domain-containing protein [Phycisphaerae bacterium]HSA29276.1 prepilin-type N-terminal cleavage/methylation domain-containing protein [Phycisphaerae bacterium]
MSCHGESKRAAFTLIEVLVVVAIIALLIAILIPSLSIAREQARRGVCSQNIRQMNMACIQYADSDRGGNYMFNRNPANYNNGTDSLLHIIPRYLRDPRVAICPSTENIVRDSPADKVVPPPRGGEEALSNYQADLDDNAVDAADNGGGHSYEVWGFYDGVCRYPDNTLIDGKLVPIKVSDTKYVTITHVIKTHRTVKRPFDTILLIDADDTDPNNAPDLRNNHKEAGLNIGFLDGHVVFAKPKQLARIYTASWQWPPTGWNNPSAAVYDPHLEQTTEDGHTRYRAK